MLEQLESDQATRFALARQAGRPQDEVLSAALDEGAPMQPRVLIGAERNSTRRVLRHMLAALHWEAAEAASHDEVMQHARQSPMPAALLLDFTSSHAKAVCQEMKADNRLQLIPIVAIIEDDSTDKKQAALELGADDYLSQPIHRAELTFRLRSLLRIHRFNQELIGVESIALTLARAVAAKDGYAHRHVEEVSALALMLGRALGLDPVEQKMLRYGAILHNVGKIGIPDAILEKNGPLTPREMALFHQHPRVGCDICSALKPLKPILPIIRHHMERWDGTGYPDGLRGDAIPLAAQIVGVVNVYCAMVNNRPFREAMSQEEAVEQLREHAASGAHDLELVEKFIACLKAATVQPQPAGMVNGREA